MSNNSPHFLSSKSPDFTSDSKDHTPTGGEDFKACEASKKREAEKGREAEKRSEAIKGNEIKEGYKIKEGNEIKEGYKVKEVSETEIISLSQAKNPDQPKHITPLHKGRGEPREARGRGFTFHHLFRPRSMVSEAQPSPLHHRAARQLCQADLPQPLRHCLGQWSADPHRAYRAL